MLIENQICLIKINKKNIQWYKSKGYDCNLKDEIKIKAEDLILNTRINIKYKCDCCGLEKEISYSDFTKRHLGKNQTYCKDCANIIRVKNSNDNFIAKDGFKICNECMRKLPSNTDYFFLKNDTKDGFGCKCKECRGKSFTNKLTHIPKEGYKFCIKCDNELPIDIIYFPPDKLCKDGLRNVCRECGKDGHFMEEGYIKDKYWTNEEKELLKEIYPLYTNEELVQLYFPDVTRRGLECQAYVLGVSYKTQETKNRTNKIKSEKLSGENSPMFGIPKSEETKQKFKQSIKKYYSINTGWWLGKKRSKNQSLMMSLRMKGKWAGKNNPRFNEPLIGKYNPNWRGGITALYFELRSEIKEWQKSSMENCNYKCVLSGGEFDNVHHLHPFRNIVDEVFEILNIDIRVKIEDYTESEFNIIKNKLIELHIFYGYGICLSKQLHKLFHDIYGYTKNTKEQFKEFTQRYKNFEFDEILENKFKYKNIILKDLKEVN